MVGMNNFWMYVTSHDCVMTQVVTHYCLVSLVTRASPSEAEDLGFDSCFRDRVIPVTLTLAFQWLSCQAPGIAMSALGLVGLVSVYCDWVR